MSAMQELQIRLQGTNALIARYQETLVLPSTSDLEAKALRLNMRSLQNLAKRLEAEYLEHAALEHIEVYQYRLLTGDSAPSLLGVGEAWAKLQALYATVYKSLTHALEEVSVAVPQLGFAYSFPGSVGVVVTLPLKPAGEVLLTKSPVEEASEVVFNLLESRDIQGIAQRLGPAPIQAMNDWLNVHAEHHYGLAIEWKADNMVRRERTVEYPQLLALQASVRDTKTRKQVVLAGWLNKVDDKEKTFRLVGDTGEEIEGRYDESVIKSEHTASIPARYTATISTVTEMVYAGAKKPKPLIFLERLEPL